MSRPRYPVVYVADRYRAPTPDGILGNILAAREVGKSVWRLGAVALTPHLNTCLMDGVVPDERFLEGDLELLRRCDALVLGPTWEQSVGARGERDFAIERGLPIFRWPEDRERLNRWIERWQAVEGLPEEE